MGLKKKLTNLAIEHNLLPEPEPKEEKSKGVNYDKLKTIKHNQKIIILEDTETGDTISFPSVYKASKFINKAPQTITYWAKKDGAWKNKYWVFMTEWF